MPTARLQAREGETEYISILKDNKDPDDTYITSVLHPTRDGSYEQTRYGEKGIPTYLIFF